MQAGNESTVWPDLVYRTPYTMYLGPLYRSSLLCETEQTCDWLYRVHCNFYQLAQGWSVMILL